MVKVLQFIRGIDGWVGADASEYEAPFPVPSPNACGVEVYNGGPDPALFAIDANATTPLRVIDPGTSDQILWAAPAVIYVKGNVTLTVKEIEV